MLLLSCDEGPCKMPIVLPLRGTRCHSFRQFSRPRSIAARLIDRARSEIFTISAIDYVLGSGIPDKGKILTQISAFWFDRTRPIVPNHVISTDPATYPPQAQPAVDTLRGRSMLVKKTEPLPIECVARGYLSGSGWKDYLATGQVC